MTTTNSVTYGTTGTFAIILQSSGLYCVQNLRTGLRSRPMKFAAATRVLKGIER